MNTSVTRRYHFAASHRLESAELTPAENAQIYGKCNNPYGHGHDYTLEVTISGPLNPETGLIVPYLRLDKLVESKVLQLFANRNINLDVPAFVRLVPTTENMALVIAQILQDAWEEHFSSHPKLSRNGQGDESLSEPRIPKDEAAIFSVIKTINDEAAFFSQPKAHVKWPRAEEAA